MTDWLLGTLLATSALIMLVLLVREPVRRRFGSRVAYGLWLIPAARLLMPTLTESVERTVPAAPPLQPLIHPVVDEPLLRIGRCAAQGNVQQRPGHTGGGQLAQELAARSGMHRDWLGSIRHRLRPRFFRGPAIIAAKLYRRMIVRHRREKL